MTATELREFISAMDTDSNKLISFIELSCAMYKKDISELSNFVDEEARQRAINEAMRASQQKREAEEQIKKAQEAQEMAAQIRAAALERESKLVSPIASI